MIFMMSLESLLIFDEHLFLQIPIINKLANKCIKLHFALTQKHTSYNIYIYIYINGIPSSWAI